MMLFRVLASSSVRIGLVVPGDRLSGVDMVTDVPEPSSDTKLIRCGRQGVRSGESSAA
jgi:hypothetical protein